MKQQKKTDQKKKNEPKIEIFSEPFEIDFKSHNGMESLIANPQPPAPPSRSLPMKTGDLSASRNTSKIAKRINSPIEPEHAKELPVQIMVQSPQDVHNNYTVIDGDNHEDNDEYESFLEDYEGEEEDEDKPSISDKQTTIFNARGSTKEFITSTKSPEISTVTQQLTTTTTSTTSKPVAVQVIPSSDRRSISEGQVKKETGKETKATKEEPQQEKIKKKESPSLDKIAERVFERFKNHEEIPSYEDLWYDDNGEVLFSQEANLGRNVKRQVDNTKDGRPCPREGTTPAKDELQKMREVTDTIDRFRVMLELAQQVEYYLSKRLLAGMNALTAIYEEEPKTRR